LLLLVAHRAVAAAGVNPVLLDQVLAAAKGNVVLRPVRSGVLGPEGPCALVGILFAAAVVPGVEVGVSGGFLELVRDDAGRAISSGRAIGAVALRFACRRATGRISDERVLDVAAGNCAIRVPAAVLGAEAAGLVNIGRGQHEIDPVSVLGKSAA